MPIVFLFTRMEGVKTMLGDGDTGWHIRTGRMDSRQWPRAAYQDIFSYTKAGQPWYAWEWLWDACVRLAVSSRRTGHRGSGEHPHHLA